jgi:ERI1 exoribonuclease 3
MRPIKPSKPYICVIDFEANCSGENAKDHEIIEFPALLYDVGYMSCIATFRQFVRPVKHQSISPFIQNLCNITQDDMKTAIPWQECLNRFEAWCEANDVTSETTTIVTCGDWDLKTMLPKQLALTRTRLSVRLQKLFDSWTNIKLTYKHALKNNKMIGMDQMLKELQLKLIGTHHCGIDDCYNIAQIARELVRKENDISVPNNLRREPYHFGGSQHFYRKGNEILPNKKYKVVFMH